MGGRTDLNIQSFENFQLLLNWGLELATIGLAYLLIEVQAPYI